MADTWGSRFLLGGRADDHSVVCHALVGGEIAREAEVGQHGAEGVVGVAVEQDVGGFEVAVDDVEVVGGLEGEGGVMDDADFLFEGELLVRGFERGAIDG